MGCKNVTLAWLEHCEGFCFNVDTFGLHLNMWSSHVLGCHSAVKLIWPMFPLFTGRRREFPGCSTGVGGTSACYPAPAEARTPRRAPASLGGAHCRMPPPLATLVLVVSTVLSIAGEFSVLLYSFLLADHSTAWSWTIDAFRGDWSIVWQCWECSLSTARVLDARGC